MIRRPPRSTQSRSSAASDVYKRQWMRLAAHADVGYVQGVDQAFYRLHGQNMTVDRNKIVDLRQRQLAFDVLLDTCGDRLTNPDHLYGAAHRKLSWEAIQCASR